MRRPLHLQRCCACLDMVMKMLSSLYGSCTYLLENNGIGFQYQPGDNALNWRGDVSHHYQSSDYRLREVPGLWKRGQVTVKPGGGVCLCSHSQGCWEDYPVYFPKTSSVQVCLCTHGCSDIIIWWALIIVLFHKCVLCAKSEM